MALTSDLNMCLTCGIFSFKRYRQLPVYTPWRHRGSRGIAPLILLTSALEWVFGQPQAPETLHSHKTRCPQYKKLGGSQNLSGHLEKRTIPCPCWDSSPGSFSREPSYLYLLSYRGPSVRCFQRNMVSVFTFYNACFMHNSSHSPSVNLTESVQK